MGSAGKLFTIEGRGLKLDTAADVEPHIKDLQANDVEEVRFLGNTLGVEACRLLGEVLATKKNLKVRRLSITRENASGLHRRPFEKLEN